MSYPSPLLAEKLDREALDGMWAKLRAEQRRAEQMHAVTEQTPKLAPPQEQEPVQDGTDRMSDYLRTSAIAYYCWMSDGTNGEDMDYSVLLVSRERSDAARFSVVDTWSIKKDDIKAITAVLNAMGTPLGKLTEERA